eukprot:TRINITY_DN7940_c0_g1_i1.p2 TRINITY_DN7940_c0_g1~~TRINITY_DN7940_c0_g1_i1.p2  ORF type:complete len:357 (+),score=51.68 TRINITY_DN7940_c0_g1_i1:1898-2968(+)
MAERSITSAVDDPADFNVSSLLDHGRRTPTNVELDVPFLPSETHSSERSTTPAPLFHNSNLTTAFEQIHHELARGPDRASSAPPTDASDPESWQPTAYLDSSSSLEWLNATPRSALVLRIRALEQAVQYVLSAFKQTLQPAPVDDRQTQRPGHSRSASRASTISAIANSRAPSRQAATATMRSLKSKHTDIPNEYLCPITYDIMVDPVCAADGFTYERESIRTWLVEHATSPMTGSPLASNWLFPNQCLRALIRDFCDQHGVPLPEMEGPLVAEEHNPAMSMLFNRPGERSNYIPVDSTIRTHRQSNATAGGVTFLEAATGRDFAALARMQGRGQSNGRSPSVVPEPRASVACVVM